ncbi:ATP-dependent DNA helicase, partial [Frankliniella fusca]
MGNSQAHIYPPVEVLPVHEEFQQTIIHREGGEERALERHENSKLTAWFELNRREGPHRGKVYIEVVENYMYKNQAWTPSNRHTIGRLSPVAGTDFNSELYHLRLLLCNRTDVTSFEDIRTVDNEVHPTFKSACVALNLVENEEEMRHLMDELVLEQFPSTMRKTFGTLLANVNPINPRDLWDNYKQHLAEDYLHEIQDDEDLAYQLTLRDISQILQEFGKTLEDYQLPELDDDVLGRRNVPNVDADVTLTPEAVDQLLNQLSVEQRHFFEDVRRAVWHENEKKFFFLTDEGLGLSRSTLKLQSEQAQNLHEADVIIWDEVSMVHGWQLHVLDRFLRDLLRREEPFGSKINYFGWRLRQILPVVPGGSRVDIVDAAVTSSTYGRSLKNTPLPKIKERLKTKSMPTGFS